MENLRNQGSDTGNASERDADYASYEDDNEPVTPPPAIGQDERRMHVRAYNFWAGLLGERQFPSIEDLEPETSQDFGANSVLLDFTDGMNNPAIQFLGQALREECGLEGKIDHIDQVPARSLLSRITDHYLQIIANQAPIGFEAEFINQRGKNIMYRGILLPFSTDDESIDFIYGVINWKEVVDEGIAADIEDEVSQALQIPAAPVEELGNLDTMWADGPGLDTDTDDAAAEDETSDLTSDQPLELTLQAPSAFSEPANLSDWLSAARTSAEDAATCEMRSRQALYKAIGDAYDFYLMTQEHPEDYQRILEDSGLQAQERAPMTPITKLVFGAHYDKTRLTEYAAALRYAEENNIEKGDFAAYLGQHAGGLKAVVYAERASRNPDGASASRLTALADVEDRLRNAPPRQLSEMDTGTSEFVVLVARREPSGDLALLGPMIDDPKLTSKILQKTKI